MWVGVWQHKLESSKTNIKIHKFSSHRMWWLFEWMRIQCIFFSYIFKVTDDSIVNVYKIELYQLSTKFSERKKEKFSQKICVLRKFKKEKSVTEFSSKLLWRQISWTTRDLKDIKLILHSPQRVEFFKKEFFRILLHPQKVNEEKFSVYCFLQCEKICQLRKFNELKVATAALTAIIIKAWVKSWEKNWSKQKRFIFLPLLFAKTWRGLKNINSCSTGKRRDVSLRGKLCCFWH